jgi:CheY-like chemotaxis protein
MHRAIILVDDDSSVLTLMHRMVQAAAPDYQLLSVVDGAGALALMTQRPVALVITDQHMPGMDGIALTLAIKAAAPQCLVILITGYPSPELQQRADAAGVDYFLPKPFRIDQLAAMVRAALAQQRVVGGRGDPAAIVAAPT